MYCKNCDRLLDDGVKKCHHCNNDPKHKHKSAASPPPPPPPPYPGFGVPAASQSTNKTAIGVIAAVLGILGFTSIVIPLLLGVFSFRTFNYTWNDNWAWEDNWEWEAEHWDLWDDWDYFHWETATNPWGWWDPGEAPDDRDLFIANSEHVIAWELVNSPQDLHSRRVSVRASIDSVEYLEAGQSIYGTLYTHPVYVLHVQDRSGPMIITIAPWQRNASFLNYMPLESGVELRFYGVFWGLVDADGEPTPLLDVQHWDRTMSNAP